MKIKLDNETYKAAVVVTDLKEKHFPDNSTATTHDEEGNEVYVLTTSLSAPGELSNYSAKLNTIVDGKWGIKMPVPEGCTEEEAKELVLNTVTGKLDALNVAVAEIKKARKEYEKARTEAENLFE